MIVALTLLALIFILIFGFFVGKYNESYWKKRGVVFHKKNKAMGLLWDFLTKDRSMFLLFQDLYKQYPDEPAVAFGSLLTPSLYVKDPDNINYVMQNDFQSFTDRGMGFSKNDKLAQNIIFVEGSRWKLLRNKLTTLFTANKLKNMFYIIDRSAEDFIYFLKNNPEKLNDDAFATLDSYSCAAIAGAVFGIGTESTFDSRFLHIAKTAILPTSWKNFKFAVSCLSSSLFRALDMSMFSVQEEYFIDAIKQVLRKRQEENLKNYDFIDLCISLQKNGTMKDSETGMELEPTDELLAAQAFFFFVAGVEPCTAGMFAMLFELGRRPDILQRVHEEVDQTFDKFNAQITYEAVSEMVYLDKVINETLRMHPPIGFILRECVQDTVLPVGNIKIDRGTKIYTPIYEIHHDPNFFSEPEVFDPERFSRDETQISNLSFFMPYGKGYRNCIGLRYAQLQVKTGIAHLLRHFTVKSTVKEGGVKYKKEQLQLRLKNVNFEFIARE